MLRRLYLMLASSATNYIREFLSSIRGSRSDSETKFETVKTTRFFAKQKSSSGSKSFPTWLPAVVLNIIRGSKTDASHNHVLIAPAPTLDIDDDSGTEAENYGIVAPAITQDGEMDSLTRKIGDPIVAKTLLIDNQCDYGTKRRADAIIADAITVDNHADHATVRESSMIAAKAQMVANQADFVTERESGFIAAPAVVGVNHSDHATKRELKMVPARAIYGYKRADFATDEEIHGTVAVAKDIADTGDFKTYRKAFAVPAEAIRYSSERDSHSNLKESDAHIAQIVRPLVEVGSLSDAEGSVKEVLESARLNAYRDSNTNPKDSYLTAEEVPNLKVESNSGTQTVNTFLTAENIVRMLAERKLMLRFVCVAGLNTDATSLTVGVGSTTESEGYLHEAELLWEDPILKDGVLFIPQAYYAEVVDGVLYIN